jgi:hypothetical protein
MFLIAILNNYYSIGYKSMLLGVVFIRVRIKGLSLCTALEALKFQLRTNVVLDSLIEYLAGIQLKYPKIIKA